MGYSALTWAIEERQRLARELQRLSGQGDELLAGSLAKRLASLELLIGQIREPPEEPSPGSNPPGPDRPASADDGKNDSTGAAAPERPS